MATYKEKVGTSVVNYAGNYPGAVEGELWYDSTNKNFNYQYPNVTAAGSWRTGGTMNTARRQFGPSGSGTTTASLVFGGRQPFMDLCESYDGVSWTEVADLNTAVGQNGGAGTQTAALSIGGEIAPGPSVSGVESWNGASWTEITSRNNAVSSPRGAGLQGAAIAYGGGGASAIVIKKM